MNAILEEGVFWLGLLLAIALTIAGILAVIDAWRRRHQCDLDLLPGEWPVDLDAYRASRRKDRTA